MFRLRFRKGFQITFKINFPNSMLNFQCKLCKIKKLLLVFYHDGMGCLTYEGLDLALQRGQVVSFDIIDEIPFGMLPIIRQSHGREARKPSERTRTPTPCIIAEWTPLEVAIHRRTHYNQENEYGK